MLRPADVWTMARAPEGTAVLIRPAGSDVAVPIFVDHCIAQSIYIALRGEQQSRPLTHDLFLQTLAVLKVSVERVEITEIKNVGGNGTFFARLVLMQDGRQVEVDSRTSDAIAIALRPTISFGRPGICTSPAEISVVTPPCSVESIHPNCCWRGV